MNQVFDMTDKFCGRWHVIRPAGIDSHRNMYWWCRCSCGTERKVLGTNLRNGVSSSCGCLYREQKKSYTTTHGYAVPGKKSRTYSSWQSMLARVRQQTRNKSEIYFGIELEPRWNFFRFFLEDMGKAPSEIHSIDRIDGKKGYTKDNCRWATQAEQMRNTTRNVFVTYRDKTRCVSDWADFLGVSRAAFARRIRMGWDIEDAMTIPYGRSNTRYHTKKLKLAKGKIPE